MRAAISRLTVHHHHLRRERIVRSTIAIAGASAGGRLGAPTSPAVDRQRDQAPGRLRIRLAHRRRSGSPRSRRATARPAVGGAASTRFPAVRPDGGTGRVQEPLQSAASLAPLDGRRDGGAASDGSWAGPVLGSADASTPVAPLVTRIDTHVLWRRVGARRIEGLPAVTRHARRVLGWPSARRPAAVSAAAAIPHGDTGATARAPGMQADGARTRAMRPRFRTVRRPVATAAPAPAPSAGAAARGARGPDSWALPLVWRASRPGAPDTPRAGEVRLQAPVERLAPVAAPLQPAPPVAVLPRSPAARQAPAPPSFDGAALDRLADDVMQRIERRIRIERERRGL